MSIKNDETSPDIQAETGEAVQEKEPVQKKRRRAPKKKLEIVPVSNDLPLFAERENGELPHQSDDTSVSESTNIEAERLGASGSISQTQANETSCVLPSLYKSTAWCFLTNRSNLLSILGSGMITPASDAWRYVPDSREAAGGGIPLWSGNFPEKLSEFLTGRGSASPVILEFLPSIENWLPPGTGNIRVSPSPLPFSEVAKVRFKDRETLDDFRLKQFDDLPELQNELLEDNLGLPDDGGVAADIPAHGLGIPVRNFEKAMGALISVSDSLHGRTAGRLLYCEFVEALCRQIAMPGDLTQTLSLGSLFAQNSQGATSADGDLWLLRTTLDCLVNITSESGFDAFSFVSELESRARRTEGKDKTVDSIDLSQILRWCEYTKKLLDGSEELKPLTDSKSIIQRGVLLFLLRPEPERFRKVANSSIRPGAKVYLLASFLIGYFVGLPHIQSPIKRIGNQFFALVAHFLKLAIRPGDQLKSVPDLKFIKKSEESGSLVVTHEGFPIGSWDVQLGDTLQQIFHQARRVGLACTCDFLEEELHCRVGEGNAVTVKIRALPEGGYGDVIRIYGECGEFSSSEKTHGAIAISLLMQNGLSNTHGKFALLDSGSKLIFAQDQLVDTIGQSELRAHVGHVADVVGRYVSS